MMVWLVGAQVVAFLLWVGFTVDYEVPLNVRLIRADGSADTLKRGFHQRRTNVRMLVALPLILGPALAVGLGLGWARAAWTAVGLGLLLGGFFLRTFGPLLNVGLGLSYKARFFASYASASFPDAQIWWWVRRGHPGAPDEALQGVADETNHHLLNFVGLGCVVAYTYCLWRTFGGLR